MKRARCFIVLLLLPLALKAEAAATAPEDLYKEAVLQETTNRDLEAAIKLYQQVLQQPAASRMLQSNAYLRLGLCQEKLGRTEEAKASWSRVITDYSDQTAAYQEAKTHLQELAVEAGKNAQVQPSTPTVVYAIPKTRGEFRLGGIGYSSTAGWILSFPSLSWFYKPNRAIGLEGSYLPEQSFAHPGTYDTTITPVYIGVTHHWETPLGNQFRPYLNIGPAAYQFYGSGQTPLYESATKWSAGAVAEAGLTIGWSRGFIFALGYNVNAYYRPTMLGVSGGFDQVHGMRLAVGYRW